MKLYEGCILLSVYFQCLNNWRGVFVSCFAAAVFGWLEKRYGR